MARASTPDSELPPLVAELPESDLLRRALKTSLIVHVGLLVFIILKSLVFPSSYTMSPPSLRVDIVDLPDVLKKDLKKTPMPTSDEVKKALEKVDKEVREAKSKKAKAPPVEEAAPDEMVLKPKDKGAPDKKREKKMKSALDRIKALSKISDDEEIKVAPVKGNILSKGTSLSGEARENVEATYADLVRDRAAEYWELNPLLARQKLTAKVRIHIDNQGRLIKVNFTQLSGNPKFDEEVKRAIQRAAPFPKPPAPIAEDILTSGVGLAFPL